MKIICCLMMVAGLSLARDGGEIGNAYRAYSSFLGGYSISYPKTWNYYDLDRSVSFVEAEKGPQGKVASLSVRDRNFPNVATAQDLLDQIRFFHPNENWESVVLGGTKGYQSISEKEGIVYLLRGKESVLSLRFDSADKKKALEQIRHMMSSLEIQ